MKIYELNREEYKQNILQNNLENHRITYRGHGE